MTSRVQHGRSDTPGELPVGPPGSIVVNTADRQIAAVDPAGVTRPLVGMRRFSSTASYAADELVARAGLIYRSLGAVAPGPWARAQWRQIDISSVLIQPTEPEAYEAQKGAIWLDTSDGSNYRIKIHNGANWIPTVNGLLPTTGGTLTGDLAAPELIAYDDDGSDIRFGTGATNVYVRARLVTGAPVDKNLSFQITTTGGDLPGGGRFIFQRIGGSTQTDAAIDPAGTTVPSTFTVLTAEKGDARYYFRSEVDEGFQAINGIGEIENLKVSGTIVVRGGADATAPHIFRNPDHPAGIIFRDEDGDPTARINFVLNGVTVARLYAFGQPLTGTSLLTKQMADTLYATKSGGGGGDSFPNPVTVPFGIEQPLTMGTDTLTGQIEFERYDMVIREAFDPATGGSVLEILQGVDRVARFVPDAAVTDLPFISVTQGRGDARYYKRALADSTFKKLAYTGADEVGMLAFCRHGTPGAVFEYGEEYDGSVLIPTGLTETGSDGASVALNPGLPSLTTGSKWRALGQTNGLDTNATLLIRVT